MAHLELLGAPCARSELNRLVCELVLKRCGAKEWWHGGDSRSEWQTRGRDEGGVDEGMTLHVAHKKESGGSSLSISTTSRIPSDTHAKSRAEDQSDAHHSAPLAVFARSLELSRAWHEAAQRREEGRGARLCVRMMTLERQVARLWHKRASLLSDHSR